MSFYQSLCILAAMAFAIAFMNQYIIRMQTTIAITSGALLLSLLMLVMGKTLWPGLQEFAITLLSNIDFEEFVLSECPRAAGRKACHRLMKTRDGAAVGPHVVRCRLLVTHGHTGSAGEQHGIPRPLRRTHDRQPRSIEPDNRYGDIDAV